jgi:glycosyltransferase involved in cell wall biosynthesis
MISVITPCLNGEKYIECAIQSVLAQRYDKFEHVVIDGGSTDGTMQILGKYPHVKWSSGPDKGQSDAMNRGFAASTGDLIVYLNADDYFHPNAFAAVLPAFSRGAHVVMGRVEIIGAEGSKGTHDPKATLPDMLRWWMADAYCYNPVGYFYRRQVQEAVGPFNVDDHYTMDFEFLIEAAKRYTFTRIPDVLGCFRLIPGTKTFDNKTSERDLFARFEKYLFLLDAADRQDYLKSREAYLNRPLP